MTEPAFDPRDPDTWHDVAKHPVYRGLAPLAVEWSLDPAIYEGASFGAFAPEWYSDYAEPIPSAEGTAHAQRDLRCLRYLARVLRANSADWHVELCMLDDMTMFLLVRRPPLADCSVFPCAEGPALYAAEDTDDERAYRPLALSKVLEILGHYAAGGSLDAFSDLES